MKREDVKVYRERLLAIRARLRGDARQMSFATFSTASAVNRMPLHPAEVAGNHYDCEMNLRLVGTKEQLIREIERALESIEDGTYGVCRECGRRIPRARLDAMPYATECVNCASE